MACKKLLFIITLKVLHLQTTPVSALENSTSSVPSDVDVKHVLSDLQKSVALMQRQLEKINLSESATNDHSNELFESEKRNLTRMGYNCSDEVGWHKLHTTRRTWNRARKSCESEGAHLAVINSEAEAQVLSEILKRTGFFSAFVGIHDQFEEGDWITINGESIDKTGYVRWFDGLPNNYQTYNLTEVSANCGTLNDEGAFMDVYCYKKYSYICEYPLVSINC